MRTIGEALKRAAEPENREYLYSFDMLGEAARTARDAARHFEGYGDALGRVAREAGTAGDIARAPRVSVKLSPLRCIHAFPIPGAHA